MEGQGLFKLSGLWKRRNREGEQYLGGTLGSVSILVFRNKHKTAENQPDYILSLGTKNGNGNGQPRPEAEDEF